jgi:uncharacterized membrane protein
MPSFAARNGAQGIGRMKTAMLAVLLALGACGDNSSAAKPGDPQTGAPAIALQGSSSSATGASDPVGSSTVATPSGPLDTTTWVLAPPFAAGGDEPFWRMEIVDGWFSFKRAGLRAIEEPLVQPKQEGGGDVFDTGALRVTIKRESCSTEQGGTGEFSVTVRFGNDDFDGCAFSGQIVAASAEAATVADALTPIDACLAKLGQPALATAVYPRQDGEQTAVALSAKTGAFYECVTEGGGTNVVSLDPIDQGSQASWMRRMRFLRDGVASAAASCADAEEVRVGDKVVGRLLGKSCKF